MSVDTHDSPRTITWSPRPTLGVEQELHTVRRRDYQLVGAAAPLVEALRALPGYADRVTTEYMANTIEVTTPICTTPAESVAFLRRVHADAVRIASASDVALSPLGIHPFADPADQAVTPTPRYLAAREREGAVGEEQQIIGTHVHVGVPDGDAAVRVMDALAVATPMIIALAASSPFHRATDTGFEAFRPMLGDRLPPSGVAPHFATWDDFVTWYDGMQATGYVTGLTDIWWDVRPSRFGTVELRIADGIAEWDTMAGVVALVQCLTVEAVRDGDRLEPLPTDQLRLNRFEAQRYGLDATVSLAPRVARDSLRSHLTATLHRLAPLASELGCRAELDSLAQIAERGSSARRQRAIYARTGSLANVVADAVARLTTPPAVTDPGHQEIA